ncbi:MAG: hypothetical protein HQ564_06865 [Candidatus Saganbacteria bacterium]|nr:hypothetical protein [Candidatus Saganbacteria bacterium]
MTELDLQRIVVSLHGPGKKETLKTLKEQKELHKEIPIQRAVAYILQFGDTDSKAIAAQLAQVMNLGVDSN